MKALSFRFTPRRAMTVLVLLASLPAAQANGQDNFEGVWKLASPPAAFRPVDNGEVPFTKEGQQAFATNQAAYNQGDYSYDKATSRCSSPGLPRVMKTPKLIKIYQRPQVLTMMFEWNRLFRQIDLRAGERRQMEAPTMMGQSYGRWEGVTLVVESNDLSPQTTLDGVIPHSEKMTLVERLRMVNKDTLEDQITITDPETFTKPWTVVLTYKRQADNLFPFAEDICLDHKPVEPLRLESSR